MSETVFMISVPKWGMAMEEGTVLEWHVRPGDPVVVGDDIADIETSKITNTVECQVQGILRRQLVQPGDTLEVGAAIGVVTPNMDVTDQHIDDVLSSYLEVEPADGEQADNGSAVYSDTILFDDTPVFYTKYPGKGTEPGRPVVLVHGYGGSADNWMFNASALTGEQGDGQRDVYVLDLPGHGKSLPFDGALSVKRLTETLVAILSSLQLEQVHLVGHSLGGAVALQAALEDSSRISSLSLIAPAGLGREINDDYIDSFSRASRRKDVKNLLQELVYDEDVLSKNMVEEILKYLRKDGVKESLQSIARSLCDKGDQRIDLSEQFSRLATQEGVASQVIWGEEDRIIPCDSIERLDSSIEVLLLAGVGHMPHMEKPESVNPLLERFFLINDKRGN